VIDDIAEILDEWKTEVMPRVRVGIKELRAEYPDFERERRTEYLKGRMEEMIFKTFYLMNDYDDLSKGNDVDSRLFVGGQIIGSIKTIRKLQGEIIALRRPEGTNKNEITEDMKQRAREVPFESLLPGELKRGRCACPIHGGKNVMSFEVKDNRGKCYSCHWSGDTVQFVMDTQGKNFPDAVRYLIA